jgi:hypothetical protein
VSISTVQIPKMSKIVNRISGVLATFENIPQHIKIPCALELKSLSRIYVDNWTARRVSFYHMKTIFKYEGGLNEP